MLGADVRAIRCALARRFARPATAALLRRSCGGGAGFAVRWSPSARPSHRRHQVSGYFDPFHVGHLEYLEKSKEAAGGDKNAHLIVIVNNDHQATLKKGKPFMPAAERCKIVAALRCVDEAFVAVDEDRTCCKSIACITPPPDYFCNGGDQNNNTIPERPVCEELGIALLDGLGDKIQSSSWLIKGGGKGEIKADPNA